MILIGVIYTSFILTSSFTTGPFIYSTFDVVVKLVELSFFFYIWFQLYRAMRINFKQQFEQIKGSMITLMILLGFQNLFRSFIHLFKGDCTACNEPNIYLKYLRTALYFSD